MPSPIKYGSSPRRCRVLESPDVRVGYSLRRRDQFLSFVVAAVRRDEAALGGPSYELPAEAADAVVRRRWLRLLSWTGTSAHTATTLRGREAVDRRCAPAASTPLLFSPPPPHVLILEILPPGRAHPPFPWRALVLPVSRQCRLCGVLRPLGLLAFRRVIL